MKINSKLLALLTAVGLVAPVLGACQPGVQPSSQGGDASSLVDNTSESIPGTSVDPTSIAPSTSTGGTDTSSSTVDQGSPVTRVKVTPPTQVIVGETYDLDDYVEVTGGKGPKIYTIEDRSEGKVYIKPNTHEVMIIDEGDITLRITAENLGTTKSASFNTIAISELANQYKEATKDVTNVYTAYEIVEDEETGKEELSLWAVHQSDYFFSPVLSGFSIPSEKRSVFVGGGLVVLRNQKLYPFNVYEDTGVELGAKMGSGSDFNNYNITYDYNLPYSAFTTDDNYIDGYGESIEALRVCVTDQTYIFDSKDNFGNVFHANFWNALEFDKDKNLYCPHTVWVYPFVLESGQELWRFDLALAKTTSPEVRIKDKFVSFAIDFDEDNAVYEDVVDFIANGELPVEVTYNEIPEKFDDINEVKNFTVRSEVTICKENDKENETSEYDDDGKFLSSDMESEARVTEKGYYSTYKGEFDEALYEKDGKLYQLDAEGASAAVEGINALWDTNRTTDGLSSGSKVYEDFEISTRSEDEDGVTFEFLPGDCQLFIRNILPITYVGRRVLGQIDGLISNYPEYSEATIYNIFDAKISVYEEGIHLELSMSWEEDTYAYIDFYFTDIGTTTIPELASYLA